MSASEQPEFDAGTAGASARREHERRRANRERRVRDKHPRIGGLLLALRTDPAHEAAWARGASGEEHVARVLADSVGDGVIVLHDRRIPRSRANIDHIAVGPTGVWVIDTKRCTGKVALEKPLRGPVRLTIAGRDRTKLIDGLTRQVAHVHAVMADVALGIPVHGALCFVDAELPLLRNVTFSGYPLLRPKRLAKLLNSDGPHRGEVREMAAGLAQRFPPA